MARWDIYFIHNIDWFYNTLVIDVDITNHYDEDEDDDDIDYTNTEMVKTKQLFRWRILSEDENCLGYNITNTWRSFNNESLNHYVWKIYEKKRKSRTTK